MQRLIRSAWRRSFIRFLFVGALNTAFGYGVYAAGILLGLRPAVALLVAFLLGVVFNFRTTGAIVFRSHDLRRILRFVLVYVPVYFVNLGFLELLRRAGLGPLVAQAICIPPVVVATYIAMKTLVFRTAAADGTHAQAD
jgi:putative flippase GtrA